MALDSFATPATVDTYSGKNAWAVSATISDATTAEEIVPAPTNTNQSLFITGIIINTCTAAVNPSIEDEDETTLFGPFFSSDNGVLQIQWKFTSPVKVAAGKAIYIKAAGAGELAVYVEGFTA